LIENPIEVGVDFLTTAGFDASEIDSTWRTRTSAHLESLDLKLAGVLDGDETLATVLTRMLALMASWWRDGRGMIVFKSHFGPAGVSESDIAAYLTPRQFGEAGLSAQADEESVCTRAVIEYAFSPAKGTYEGFSDGASMADLAAESWLGVMSKKFQLGWVRQASCVSKLQELAVAAYAQAPLLVSGRLASLNHAYLEKGDVVAVSLDWLYDQQLNPWRNQLCRVLTVQADWDNTEVGLELLDLGLFLTTARLADGSGSAGGTCLAGGERDRQLYA